MIAGDYSGNAAADFVRDVRRSGPPQNRQRQPGSRQRQLEGLLTWPVGENTSAASAANAASRLFESLVSVDRRRSEHRRRRPSCKASSALPATSHGERSEALRVGQAAMGGSARVRGRRGRRVGASARTNRRRLRRRRLPRSTSAGSYQASEVERRIDDGVVPGAKATLGSRRLERSRRQRARDHAPFVRRRLSLPPTAARSASPSARSRARPAACLGRAPSIRVTARILGNGRSALEADRARAASRWSSTTAAATSSAVATASPRCTRDARSLGCRRSRLARADIGC